MSKSTCLKHIMAWPGCRVFRSVMKLRASLGGSSVATATTNMIMSCLSAKYCFRRVLIAFDWIEVSKSDIEAFR